MSVSDLLSCLSLCLVSLWLLLSLLSFDCSSTAPGYIQSSMHGRLICLVPRGWQQTPIPGPPSSAVLAARAWCCGNALVEGYVRTRLSAPALCRFLRASPCQLLSLLVYFLSVHWLCQVSVVTGAPWVATVALQRQRQWKSCVPV